MMTTKTPQAEAFGQALRARIEARDQTQAEVAAAAGMQFQNLNAIVQGARLPTIGTLLRVARAVGWTARDLGAVLLGLPE